MNIAVVTDSTSDISKKLAELEKQLTLAPKSIRPYDWTPFTKITTGYRLDLIIEPLDVILFKKCTSGGLVVLFSERFSFLSI